jgi:hypothetical protein
LFDKGKTKNVYSSLRIASGWDLTMTAQATAFRGK